MKRLLLLYFIALAFNDAIGQDISAKDLLYSASFSPKKFESYLNKRKFSPSGSRFQFDTLVNIYSLKAKKKHPLDRIKNIETYKTKNTFSFALITSSEKEFRENFTSLKQSGFFCGNENDSTATSYLFQQKNVSVLATIERSADTLYTFTFLQTELPPPEKITYAEDLLMFKSHEQFVSVFGEKNVIKDVYYFMDQKTSKCSVLFPKTNRQAVIIWNDEINLCDPEYLLVGGNLSNSGSENFDGLIAENSWNSKDGIYFGMNLSALVKLNGNEFKVYGKDSKFPLMVVPENTGTLNFKKTRIVFSCLNPNILSLQSNAMISTSDILNETSGLYVSMIMFLPPDESYKDSARK